MATLLTINVTNNTSSVQSFYVFQQPAVFTGGAQVYSNSLYSQALPPSRSSGSVLSFQVREQPYAGIQQAMSRPQVGQASGHASATRAIALAPAGGAANSWTTASVNPLGLSPPTSGSGLQPGHFRITTPTYQPNELYNVGSVVEALGFPTLSSFVLAQPSMNIDCRPTAKFYVQTGSYTPGTVINFGQSAVNAAVCDFGGGQTSMAVTLNADGSWSVQGR